jgi:hypothetical protein
MLKDSSRQVRHEAVATIAALTWRERSLRPRMVAALNEVANSDPDAKIRDEAKSLTRHL